MTPEPFNKEIFPDTNPEGLAFELDEIRDIFMRGEAIALSGGIVLAWWGFLLGVTNLYRVLVTIGLPIVDWPIAPFQVILGYGGTFVITKVTKNNRLLTSWRSQAISAIWVFSGFAIIIFVLGSQLAKVDDPRNSTAFFSIIFGLIMAVMATSSREKWLLRPAIAWMAIAFINFLISDWLPRLLLLGFGSLLFMMVPGLILFKHERLANSL